MLNQLDIYGIQNHQELTDYCNLQTFISIWVYLPSNTENKQKKDALDFCTFSYELNKHPIVTAVAAVVIDVELEAS